MTARDRWICMGEQSQATVVYSLTEVIKVLGLIKYLY